MRDDREESYEARENLWDEQWPEDESDPHGTEPDEEDELTAFPDAVGTTDAIRSVEDAEPYDAPIDPPVLPGGRYGVHVATGFGLDAEEEAARDGDLRDDEDIRQEVVLTLRGDSLTAAYPLHVRVSNGVVQLTGRVPSIDDAEHAQAVISNVSGVRDVVDDTTLDPDLSS